MMNKFIFFGTDDFSIEVLKVLLENNFKPSYCITQPDRPKGRNLVLTPPDIKVFCENEGILVLQPEDLRLKNLDLRVKDFDFFVVASYGKIIPKEILDIPTLGSLNVHPSLLPKYRGATPIETAILNNDKKTGVTIMLVDEKMDHGPILLQKEIDFQEFKSKKHVRDTLAKVGGEMLAKVIPDFVEGKIKAEEQNHNNATFTKMIKKEDGEIHDTDFELKKWLKFVAYNPWPGTFFFIDKGNSKIRVKITDAVFEDNHFKILRVIPEGKKEMGWQSFENGFLK